MSDVGGVNVPLADIYRDLVRAHEEINKNKQQLAELSKWRDDTEKRMRAVEWKVYSVVGGVLMGFTSAIVLIVKNVIS